MVIDPGNAQDFTALLGFSPSDLMRDLVVIFWVRPLIQGEYQ
jgi:hypothetical protein